MRVPVPLKLARSMSALLGQQLYRPAIDAYYTSSAQSTCKQHGGDVHGADSPGNKDPEGDNE